MKTMSAIYQKVRHRLNDDWAYGNGEYSLTCQKLNFCATFVKLDSCVVKNSAGFSLLFVKNSFDLSAYLKKYMQDKGLILSNFQRKCLRVYS